MSKTHPLIDLYRAVSGNAHFDQPWLRALHSYLSGNEISSSEIDSLLSQCTFNNLGDIKERLRTFKRLLFLVLASGNKGSPLLRQKLEVIGPYLRDASYPLSTAIFQLSEALLEGKTPEIDPDLLSNGAPLTEGAGLHFGGSIPYLQNAAELGMIWAVLALKGYPAYRDAVLKLAKWLTGFLDHNGIPFSGIWLREDEHSISALLTSYCLLFDLCGYVGDSEEMHSIALNLWDHLHRLKLSQALVLPSLPLMLACWRQAQNFPKERFYSRFKSFAGIDSQLGLVTHKDKNFSSIFTLSGWGTGMGSIRKNNISINAMGPYAHPLTDSNNFGIARVCRKEGPGFEDFSYNKQPETIAFEGWIRSVNGSWSFLKAGLTSKKTYLNVTSDEQRSISFAFFVKASRVRLQNGVLLQPGMIEQYEGRSVNLLFEEGDERISIDSDTENTMSVIPLGGKDHFWGADFLVAFDLEKTKTLNCEIVAFNE